MRFYPDLKEHSRAFTLPEVLISGTLAAASLGGIIGGYIMSAQRAEWSAYHLAAHSLAIQRLEQARAAKWDLSAEPPVDMLVSSNFPPVVEVLDIPISKTNVVYATNITTITTISGGRGTVTACSAAFQALAGVSSPAPVARPTPRT